LELASSLFTEFEDVVKSEASTQEKVCSSHLLEDLSRSTITNLIKNEILVFLKLWCLVVVVREYVLSNIESLQKVASLKSRIDAASIPAATKADLRGKISKLEVFSLLLS
jgi:hypothetical protein